jgi:hypothetical protein
MFRHHRGIVQQTLQATQDRYGTIAERSPMLAATLHADKAAHALRNAVIGYIEARQEYYVAAGIHLKIGAIYTHMIEFIEEVVGDGEGYAPRDPDAPPLQ